MAGFWESENAGLNPHDVTAPCALSVLSSFEDLASLREILSSRGWNLVTAPTFPEALDLLRTNTSIGVIVCNAKLSNGSSWKELLHDLQGVRTPPPLIVADRLADERLWAEVLNLGGYDLLMTPFAEAEVLHVTGMAWQSREHELQRTAPHATFARKPRNAPHALAKASVAGAA